MLAEPGALVLGAGKGLWRGEGVWNGRVPDSENKKLIWREEEGKGAVAKVD